MKVFALLFLVGCAFASHQSEWRWQSGRQHVFKYSGRLLTGMPQLAAHYSGIAINATVLVDVLEQNKLQLSLEHPRFAKISERLEARMNSQDGRDGQNWRELYLPEMTEVDSEIRRLLEQPIIFELYHGEIRQAKISRQEPEWSVNFKKSLALLFQTKVDSSAWQPEGNHISEAQTDRYWRTKEEGIDGICEVTYQVNELPKYMIRDRPELIPQPEKCEEQRYFEVVKTKNVNECDQRSAFSFVPEGRFQCKGPNCRSQWARTSEVRYIACGQRGNLMLQTIIQQGELNQNLFGFNSERVVSGNLQILRLEEVRSGSPKPMPSSMTTLKHMQYEYSYKNYQQDQESEPERRVPREVLREPQELAKTMPWNFAQGLSQKQPKSEIKQQVQRLMKELVEVLARTQHEDMTEKYVTMKIVTVAQGLSQLSKSEIQEIYRQLESAFSEEIQKESFKTLFFDTVMMASTPEAVKFIKEKIVNHEISKVQTITILLWLPNSVMMPTEEVLEELWQLVQSEPIRRCRMTENVARMSLATLLNKACLMRNRNLNYPTWVLGRFCSAESQIIKEKFLPYLFNLLEQSSEWEKKNEIIVTLGMLPTQEVVAKMIPLVEGRFQGQEVPRMSRMLALWTLAEAGKQVQPQVVEPIFYSIYSNPAENTEMRVAAFNAIMSLNPSMPVLHKIAARTWVEQDQEVLKTVNMALWTMAYNTIESVPSAGVTSIVTKAREVYPLIKKIRGVLPTSATIYSSEYLEKLGAGYFAIKAWTASKASFIPKDMYNEMSYVLDQFRFKLYALGIRTEGMENMYKKMVQLLTPLESGKSVDAHLEEISRKLEESVSSEFQRIIRKLNIESRQSSDKMSGALYAQWMESAPFFVNMQEMTTKTLKEKINRIFENPEELKRKLSEEQKFQYKHTADMTSYQALIPTDMGFPIILDVHMPYIVSMEGKINAQLSWLNPEVTMETKYFYSSQFYGQVGTIIPFTKEKAVTVVDQTTVYNIPATIKLHLNVPEQKLRLSLKMIEGLTRPVKMVHRHIRPFTTIQRIERILPVAISENKRIIRSQNQLKEQKMEFGEYLGMSFDSIYKTEARYADWESLKERLSLYNYNPINMITFYWTSISLNHESRDWTVNPALSVRSQEYTLVYKPTQSQTKEIAIDLKIGYASKSQSEQQILYKKVKVISESEKMQEAREEKDLLKKAIKKLVPIMIESEPVQQKSKHPERQEKILKAVEAIIENEQESVEYVQAVTLKLSTTLVSSRPRTWSYAATLVGAQGQSQELKLKTKWNVELESQHSEKKVIVKGNLQAPLLPLWNERAIRNSMIDFRYFNTLQFWRQGSKQWSIDVQGSSRTSQEQKKFSEVSLEAQRCEKLAEKKLSGERSLLSKLSEPCQKVREQARTLDEVDFEIKYHNVPHVQHYEGKVVSYLKLAIWPFMKYDSAERMESSVSESPVTAKIQFNRYTPTFDLTINRPNERLQFRQIRLPYGLSEVFPLKAGISNIKQVAQKVTGSVLYPVCKVESHALKTFDNKTLPLSLDRCYHLVAADCSEQKSFGVLTREITEEKREVKIFLGKTEIKLVPEASDIKVIVDGQEMEVRPSQLKEIRSESRSVVKAQIYKAPNKVVQLRSSKYSLDITFDGKNMVIETSQITKKGQLCGICGNQNQQQKDDIEGPKKCMYSKPEVEQASYRIRDEPRGCDAQKPLSQHIKSQLERENQQCIKKTIIPTKISKSLRTQQGECTVLKHAVVKRPGQICISKKPVTQCSAGCKPSHSDLLEKRIPFVCLREDRMAEHYAKKAERGEQMPELESHSSAFETKVPQPRSCVLATNEL